MSKTNQVVSKKDEEQKLSIKKFTIEKLQENCQKLFGVSTSTFVGATYGMTGKYTIKEMKTHIEAWKGKGVG